MNNKHIEESILERILLKLVQNEQDIEEIEVKLRDIKKRNRKILNCIKQQLREEQCEHEWTGIYGGHPTVYTCKKCNKLELAPNQSECDHLWKGTPNDLGVGYCVKCGIISSDDPSAE